MLDEGCDSGVPNAFLLSHLSGQFERMCASSGAKRPGRIFCYAQYFTSQYIIDGAHRTASVSENVLPICMPLRWDANQCPHISRPVFIPALKEGLNPSPPGLSSLIQGSGLRRSAIKFHSVFHTACVLSIFPFISFMHYACAAIHSMEQAPGHSQHEAIAPTLSEKTGPSAAEWETVKPVVRRLYRKEKRPLRDVVVILDKEFGFRATYVSHHFK
jgi:hypothetical protein